MFLALLLCVSAPLREAKAWETRTHLSLSGTWRFALDPQDLGIKASPDKWRFPDTIELPGCLQAQGFGEKPTMESEWTGEGWRYPEMFKEGQSADDFKFPFNLQPPRLYVGPAWYQRDIEIPADWKGKHITLHLERAHWQTTVWLDGKRLGAHDSLGTPQEFALPPTQSGKHVLTLRVDNRLSPVNPGPLSHSVTDATQGNWNGVVGRIELRATPAARITRLEILPHAATGKVKLRIHTSGARGNPKANIVFTGNYIGSGPDDLEFGDGPVPITGPITEHELQIPDARPWDEFAPHLYQISAHLDLPVARHTVTRTFGFRDLGVMDGRITINNRKTFLRGTLECCIFPLTGHPPTDLDSWKRIIRICKAHGLNHMRFHSWCPPEAAFAAADELGFYLQPEASSWANQGAQIGSGRPLDEWIETETGRMLEAYGHHPSFVMFAYGNEPSGPKHKKWLQDWVARWKKKDPLRLYTTAAGWPVMPGSDWHSSPKPRIQGWGEGLRSIINAQPPRTDFDWSKGMAKFPPGATISHEIGQWCVYPDFNEIEKYTGYFKAKNFQLFRDQAKRHALLPQAADFLNASGKLQVLAYKHDIEAALRTPDFGGFQLLDLHDFPGQGTALVGVLDPFWDSKPYCTPEEYSSFCGPTVPLIRTERLVLTNDQSFEALAQLAHFGPDDLKDLAINWSLTHNDQSVASGSFPTLDYPTGDLHDLGKLSIPLSNAPAPAKLVLKIGTDDFHNQWDLFVYPCAPSGTAGAKRRRSPDRGSTVPLVTDNSPSRASETHTSLSSALAALFEGKSVLWLPPIPTINNDPVHPLRAGFSPIFWNTAWTRWQPPHTLGILCDPKHPALEKFPTDSHSNWQWWEIITGSQPFILTEQKDLRSIVQPIDDWFTNRKLGLVFEAKVGEGKLIACAADLDTDLDQRPAARQLRTSLLAYMAGDAFNPPVTLTPADLEKLVRKPPAVISLGAKAPATSSEPDYEPANAIDSDPSTIWHTEYTDKKPAPPHDYTLTFPKPVSISALLLTQRQDKNANGQVKDLTILADGRDLTTATIPLHAAGHRVQLPGATQLTTLTLRIRSSHAGPYAALAEIDVVPE